MQLDPARVGLYATVISLEMRRCAAVRDVGFVGVGILLSGSDAVETPHAYGFHAALLQNQE